MNNIDFICFNFKTGGVRLHHDEAISVAGVAFSATTLEPYPKGQGGEFYSLMKPLWPERLQDGALKVNRITREELAKAPDQGAVWRAFIDFVGKFNKKRNPFGAPIAIGKNIRNFDFHFVEDLNRLHSPKKEKQTLFSEYRTIDLRDYLFAWFEGAAGEDAPEDEKMDTLRKFFGLPEDGAHHALTDARQTGELIMKFLKLHRHLQRAKGREGKLIRFRGSCAPEKGKVAA